MQYVTLFVRGCNSRSAQVSVVHCSGIMTSTASLTSWPLRFPSRSSMPAGDPSSCLQTASHEAWQWPPRTSAPSTPVFSPHYHQQRGWYYSTRGGRPTCLRARFNSATAAPKPVTVPSVASAPLHNGVPPNIVYGPEREGQPPDPPSMHMLLQGATRHSWHGASRCSHNF